MRFLPPLSLSLPLALVGVAAGAGLRTASAQRGGRAENDRAPVTYRLSQSPRDSRAALGITTSPSSSSRDTLGLLVSSVVPNGPADRAGIEEGNRIAAINGVNLRLSRADAGDWEMSDAMSRRLTRELERIKPGDQVDLRVYAGGRSRSVRLRTADSDSLYGRMRLTARSIDDRATLGIGIGSSGSRRDTLGVLVMSVVDSGPADRAGIEEGNRIAEIDGVDLRTSREDASDDFMSSSRVRRLQRELARLRPGDEVQLRVYAGGRTRSVRVTAARMSDMPRRRGGAIMFGGDGMNLFSRPFPNINGYLDNFDNENIKRAIERAMEGARRGIEGAQQGMRGLELRGLEQGLQQGLERGLNRARVYQFDDDSDPPRLRRVVPFRRVEPQELPRIRQFELPSTRLPTAPLRARAIPFGQPLRVTTLPDSEREGMVTRATTSMPAVVAGARARAAARSSLTTGFAGPTMLSFNGLRLVPVGHELAAYLGEGSDRGLLVVDVPPWASGLQPGDVMLRIDGQPVRDENGTGGARLSIDSNRDSKVDVLRDGRRLTVTLSARR